MKLGLKRTINTFKKILGKVVAFFTNTYSLDFDGVDDYVSLNSSIDLGINSTISLWVNFDAAYDGVLLGEDSYQFDYLLYLDSTGFYVRTDSVYKLYTNVLTYLTAGSWHHLAVVRSGDSIEVFVDGISRETQTGFGVSISTKFDTIAAKPGGTYPIGGKIDELAGWDNNTVSIADIYNGGAPTDLTDLSPIAWYRNGDNGSWKSPQWLIPSNENKDKVSNYSFEFDGVDDYVDTGITTTGTNDVTISCWIKTTETFVYTVSRCAFGGSDLTFGGNYTLGRLGSAFSSPNDMVVRIWNTLGTTKLNDGNWHHIAFTYDYTTKEIKAYTDGNLELTVVNTLFRSKNITIGSNGKTTYFQGNVDECALWYSVLNASEITDIYNGGTPTTLPSGAVAHWRMGEEANFTSNWLVDNSALDNYSKRSFEFDGVDDYLNIYNNTTIGRTQNISYSIWVNLDVTSRQYIIGNISSSNGGCGLQIESGDVLVFQMGDGGNDSYFNSRVANFSTYAPINTWNHILATWDGTDSKIYINGVLRNTWSPTLPYTIISYSGFTIGWRSAGFSFMTNGKLDELSLFDSGVSIGDVWDGSGQPIDVSGVSGITNYWKMGEDASFNGTDWTVPDSVGSNNGTSNAMLVDALVGEAPNYSGGGISNGMTIEDRVGEAPNSENNALSFNMESVDRTTDVPT